MESQASNAFRPFGALVCVAVTAQRSTAHARDKGTKGLVCVPFDNVQSGSSLDDVADLARLECKGGLFKLLLHITSAKESADTW